MLRKSSTGEYPVGNVLGVHTSSRFRYYFSGMLILVLVLKDSLRTFFKSLHVLALVLGVRSLSLSWSFGVRSLSLSWSLWSGPCPTCGLLLVLALVFSPCKDLFPLFRFIRI